MPTRTSAGLVAIALMTACAAGTDPISPDPSSSGSGASSDGGDGQGANDATGGDGGSGNAGATGGSGGNGQGAPTVVGAACNETASGSTWATVDCSGLAPADVAQVMAAARVKAGAATAVPGTTAIQVVVHAAGSKCWASCGLQGSEFADVVDFVFP